MGLLSYYGERRYLRKARKQIGELPSKKRNMLLHIIMSSLLFNTIAGISDVSKGLDIKAPKIKLQKGGDRELEDQSKYLLDKFYHHFQDFSQKFSDDVEYALEVLSKVSGGKDIQELHEYEEGIMQALNKIKKSKKSLPEFKGYLKIHQKIDGHMPIYDREIDQVIIFLEKVLNRLELHLKRQQKRILASYT